MTGWDLVAIAQRRIGDFWSLTQSQVYRELSAMAEAGLIRAGERGPRDRQPFELTDTGRAAFRSWLDGEPGPETIRFPLLLTLVFGRHVAPEQLQAFVASQPALHAEKLAGYESRRSAVDQADAADDPFAIATLDFGIAYEKAVLAWFDNLPREIAGG